MVTASPFRVLSCLLLALPLVACGGEGDDATEPPPPDPSLLTFETGPFEVAPGDSFECFYTDVITETELSVQWASAQQGLGGHHVIAYYTDEPRDPQHHPCNDAEMIGWRQIAGSAGKDGAAAEGLIKLPDGLATKVPAGVQLVLQAHYINTTGAPYTANDVISLKTVEPETVQHYVNYYVMVDLSIEVPPHAVATESMVCEIEEDLDTVFLVGHMHEWGKHYRLEEVDENDVPIATIYETEWSPEFTSHPPLDTYPVDSPRRYPAGTRLRQTCTWENDTEETLGFPREMCVAFFYYFPDRGEIQCVK